MNDNINNEEAQDEVEFTDDFPIEDAELVDSEESLEKKLKAVKKKLVACEKEKMDSLENLQRSKADFLNAKRRLEDSRKAETDRLTNFHIEKLLPLCDSFSMAMSNKKAWEAIDPIWRSGVEGIYNQLQSILADYKVKVVTPLGEHFNPTEHDAVANVTVATADKDGIIISVVQNGYIREINGVEELIRPAKVTVGEFTE